MSTIIRQATWAVLLALLACKSIFAGCLTMELEERSRRPYVTFVQEYLTTFVYIGEGAHLSYHLKNTGSTPYKADVEIKFYLSDDNSSEEALASLPKPITTSLKVERYSRALGNFTFSVIGWDYAEVSLRTTRGTPKIVSRIKRLGVLSNLENIVPNTFGLIDSGCKSHIIIALTKTRVDEDREWLLLDTVAKLFEEDTPSVNYVVAGEAMESNSMGKGSIPTWSRLLEKATNSQFKTVLLGGNSAHHSLYPAINNLPAATSAIDTAGADGAAILIFTCSDARNATPINTYHKITDFLCSRATKLGVKLSVLFIPEPNIRAELSNVYSDVLKNSCIAYGAEFQMAYDLKETINWQAEGGSKALLRYPNEAGQKAIAKALGKLLK